MTILSIILSIIRQMSHIVDILKPKHEKFSDQISIISDFKIKCNNFKKYHIFSHSKLEKSFETLFNLGGDWRKRSDILYSFEIYHIENELKSSNILIVYFKIKLLTVSSNSNRIIQQLQDFVEDSFKSSSKNYNLFKTVKICSYEQYLL